MLPLRGKHIYVCKKYRRVATPFLSQSGRADGKAHFEVYAIFVDSLKVNNKVLIYRCEYIEIVSQTVD